MAMMMSVQLVARLSPVLMMALYRAFHCAFSRRGVWTFSRSVWSTRSEGRWGTFLPFFELLVPFLQMSALGAASTDMLLSLPMLLSQSSSESLAG
jgi:hypothetical protein